MADESGAFDAKLREAFEPAYILDRELTGGGMSRVFLATERALNRKVVIKVLPPELAAGVNRERFRREIQLAAQLQHPHIVPLYAAGEHGELLYYTMPYIEGESLKHAIHEHGKKKPFTLREVVRILHDVSDALAYAHARGVIHRDIKPGNVLRSGSHAVVTDFGVAKAISAALPAVGMTTSGMAIGTPAYMAPEQLAGDPAGDHRIDIYAVGLLAYELLTGEAPFNETSPQATLAAQMTRDPVAVSRKRADVPPALAALVMKCLAKMPEQRPQTAHELVVELDAMAIGSGDFAPPSMPARRRGLMIAGALVAAAAIGFYFVRTYYPVEIGGRRVALSESTAAQKAAALKPVAPVPPATPVLTHAESLAIANAVERRMANRTSTAPAPAKIDSATLAAIRSDVEKSVLDSLQKMRPPEPPPGSPGSPGSQNPQGSRGSPGNQRFGRAPDFSGMTQAHIDSIVRSAGGMGNLGRINGRDGRGAGDRASFEARMENMGPPRRVIVADPPPDRLHPNLQAAANQVMDALRKQLAGTPRYILVNHDSIAAVLQQTRSRDSVMHLLAADMNVSIRAMPAATADSVHWLITLFDATSQSRSSTVNVGPVPVNSAGMTDSLAKLAARALWQLDHAPRRGGNTPPTFTPPTAPVIQPAPAPAVKKP
jgi:tRNA A-37 threonylcarbamoyl transferase component Bud32